MNSSVPVSFTSATQFAMNGAGDRTLFAATSANASVQAFTACVVRSLVGVRGRLTALITSIGVGAAAGGAMVFGGGSTLLITLMGGDNDGIVGVGVGMGVGGVGA